MTGLLSRRRYAGSTLHVVCGCERYCGDLVEADDHEFAVCKELPKAPHEAVATERSEEGNTDGH